MRVHILAGLLASTAAALCAPACVQAQQSETRDYDLPAQDLGTALRELATQSGCHLIVATELVDGLRAPALKGRFSFDAALGQLLHGSGLMVAKVGHTFVVRRDAVAGTDSAPEVLVTGTRIRGKGPVGSKLVIIDRRAIDESGFATTQQVAEAIPQNFGGGANESTSPGGTVSTVANLNSNRGSSINLRGLGPSSTLVLLNGERPPLGGFGGVFADLSMIPVSAVERIEIVPDGASAIYGSDAVAGVVNIIPRLDFHGAETSFRYGSADGAAKEIQASQLIGTRWNGGHLMLAYEYYQRNRLAASDRDFATDDLRSFGGIDHRSAYADPGTIYAGGKTFAIPSGQNGVRLTAAQLTAGTVNLGNNWSGADILPQQRRHSLFAAVSQDIAAGLRFYAQGLLSVRIYDQRQRPNFDARRTVPVTNPFYVDPIGTHLPVGVNYAFARDLGNETGHGVTAAYGGTAGLAAERGRWNIDLHGTWGFQYERSSILNRVNTARLAVALADTNPATSYNLFGDVPSTNPATIGYVRGSQTSTHTGLSWSATLHADGPLFALPAGDVRLAVGSEYRTERFVDRGGTIDTATLTPVASAPIPLHAPRRIEAGYAELLVPVFGGDATLPGFHRLTLSAAVRTEHYSDFGTTTNPKVGADWEPVAGLTVRGTYGRSFRAPSFNDLRQDPGTQAYLIYTIPDPQAASGQSNVVVLRGNDPSLKPERATTWTLGMELKPHFLPGAHASVTWYHVDYRDRIGSASTQLFNFLVNRPVYVGITGANPTAAEIAGYYASPFLLNPLNIPQTASFAAVIDARLRNLSVVRQAGLDIDAGYGFALGSGHADVTVEASYIFHIDQALTASAPSSDVVSVLGNPVNFRARGHIGWSSPRFGAVLFGNYVNGYTNTLNATPQHVNSWTTFDAQVSYRFGSEQGPFKGVKLALNASNLFDRNPPYAAYFVGTTTSAYDPENANPLRRVVSFQITKSW
ncbi:MAG: TonB-dependent receptor [Sphingomonas bacterium]|uniref:TonB-dependent receptor n=1 Tax=Sphingomonas bacterium TaxID=1895847 RepID=UPI00260861F5|nr:TonB-dependent receptor [Sphingomonas bacterium]MDB5712523.1 TonB-dependent receptor [Sphingomonas bacterium]